MRETGMVIPPCILSFMLHFTFKQFCDMLHVPVRVSLVLNALVRFCTEAHISSRPFWGGIVGANVGRGVGRGVAMVGHDRCTQKSLALAAFTQTILTAFHFPVT